MPSGHPTISLVRSFNRDRQTESRRRSFSIKMLVTGYYSPVSQLDDPAYIHTAGLIKPTRNSARKRGT